MQRRIFLRSTAFLTAGSLLFRKRALAQIFNVPPGNIKMIRGNVGFFTERGGTIGFVIDEEGIVVIDSQFADTVLHFMEEVKKLKDKPFSHLLNTHHHGDHTSGNIAFKGLVEHVVMHENALKNYKTVTEKAKSEDKALYADMTFTEELKLKVGKTKLKGHYFGAAHTNGDAVYHIDKANVAHVGDLMFNRRHPVVDRSAGASITHWAEVLNGIVKRFDKDTIYIFGHAGEGYDVTGSSADLLAFRDYLQKLMEFANAEKKAGKTREEFIKNTAVPGAPEWKGNGERTFGAAWDEAGEVK
jgi:glyoxylase-like metal-dependent hydrolase (beta-lactamase superfamily II)